jgi:KDO2-lipid IV(A) lauroyltransferase
MSRIVRRLRRSAKRFGDALIGMVAIGLIKALRWIEPARMADFAGGMMRVIGPWLPEHRIGRDNLIAAFPEKSAAEINAILAGVWDNLGRLGTEFANLDRIWQLDSAHPDCGRVTVDQANIQRFQQLADDGKPALIFGAHLANWELPAIAGASSKLDSAVLYRRPNIARLNEWITETRGALMGQLIPTDINAPLKLAEALERGAHVGMLVDQYYVRGVPVTFFGQRTMANPLLARLAYHFDCPIHGVRMVRLPGNRFRGELTDAIKPARDADGKIDIAGTMQIITSVIEGWIREHPEQWLWLHRRWRPEDHKASELA